MFNWDLLTTFMYFMQTHKNKPIIWLAPQNEELIWCLNFIKWQYQRPLSIVIWQWTQIQKIKRPNLWPSIKLIVTVHHDVMKDESYFWGNCRPHHKRVNQFTMPALSFDCPLYHNDVNSRLPWDQFLLLKLPALNRTAIALWKTRHVFDGLRSWY